MNANEDADSVDLAPPIKTEIHFLKCFLPSISARLLRIQSSDGSIIISLGSLQSMKNDPDRLSLSCMISSGISAYSTLPSFCVNIIKVPHPFCASSKSPWNDNFAQSSDQALHETRAFIQPTTLASFRLSSSRSSAPRKGKRKTGIVNPTLHRRVP